MAIAASIDALAIGISFALLEITTIPKSSLYHIISSYHIRHVAHWLLRYQMWLWMCTKLKAELWGGIILVAIGLKILIEHLFLQ